MQEKIYNIDIETTVLSSIIFKPTLLNKYNRKIKKNIFYSPTYRIIIDKILNLHKNNKVFDVDILVKELGVKYGNDLIYILSKNPASNLDDYLDILQDFSVKRDMKQLALEIDKGLELNNSRIELQAKINNLTKKINIENELDLFEIDNIDNINDVEVEFICQKWLPIPIRTVSLITAPGGTGKSWLILQLAIKAIVEGKVKKAFIWLSEDPKEISKNRFNKIFYELLKLEDNNIKSKIDISDSPTIQFLYDDYRKVEISPLFYHFKIKLEKYDLIILDPLIAFYGTDENNNSNARRFMQLFTDWANKENKTIIFIHHSTKNTTQSRGASAFTDAVRTVYEIDKIKNKEGDLINTNQRIIKLTKDNYGISNFLKTTNVKRELFPMKISGRSIKSKLIGVHEDF